MESAPLTDLEKRIVVAEAIRVSRIPIEKLLDLLREDKAPPLWDHMVLPPGRTMAMCKNAFDTLFRPNPMQTFQAISHVSGPQPSSKRKSGTEVFEQRPFLEPPAKRRQSAVEPKLGGRELAPKPSNDSSGPVGSTPGKVPKKRGRPSKADVERMKLESIRKGTIMAPSITMSTMSAKIPSEDYSYPPIAPTPPTATTGTFYDPTLKSTPDRETPQPTPQPRESPGKTKRKPPAKPRPPPGQSSFTILPPMFPPREEPPPSSNPMANIQRGPPPGLTDRMPSSLHTFPISNEPRPNAEPRPDN